jgi:hypothetical protein
MAVPFFGTNTGPMTSTTVFIISREIVLLLFSLPTGHDSPQNEM